MQTSRFSENNVLHKVFGKSSLLKILTSIPQIIHTIFLILFLDQNIFANIFFARMIVFWHILLNQILIQF